MIYYIIFLIVCGFVMFEYFRRYFKDLNTITEVKEVKKDINYKDALTKSEIEYLDKRIDDLKSPLPLKNKPAILDVDYNIPYDKLSMSEIEYLNNKRNDLIIKNISKKIEIYGETKPTILDIDRSIPATLKGYKDLVKEQSYIDYVLKTKGEDYIMNLEFLYKEYSTNIDVELEDEIFYSRKINCNHTDWQIKAMHNYYLKNKNQPKV